MTKNPLCYDVLALMDRAVVRGASSFTDADADLLRRERDKWTEAGGADAGSTLIDSFIATTTLARDAAPGHPVRLDLEVLRLKSAWRDRFGPAGS